MAEICSHWWDKCACWWDIWGEKWQLQGQKQAKLTATAIATAIEFRRRHPELLSKDFGKVAEVVEPHGVGDLGDGAGLLL